MHSSTGTAQCERTDQFLERLCLDMGIKRKQFDHNYNAARMSLDGNACLVEDGPNWKALWQVFRPFDQCYAMLGRGTYPTRDFLRDLPKMSQGGNGQDVLTVFILNKGELRFILDNKTHRIRAGECVIFRRTRRTAFDLILGWGGEIEAIGFYFTMQSFREVLRQHCVNAPDVVEVLATDVAPEQCVIRIRDATLASSLSISDLYEASETPEKAKWVRHKVGELFILLSMILPSSAVTLSSRLKYADIKRLNQAKSHIDKAPGATHHANELAEMCGLHPRKLARGFRILYGTSVGEYTKSRRLEYARHLLDETEHNLSEIADLCGYENRSNLSRAIKKHFGRSPRAIRRGSSELVS